MIPDLRDIWAQDRNGDGIVDYLNARIYVPDSPTPAELAAAANIAARLAFETTSMDLPIGFTVSQYAPGDQVSIFVGGAASGRSHGPRTVLLPILPEAERFAKSAAIRGYARTSPPRQSAAESKRLSLASLFTREFLLRDADGDFVPELMDATLLLGPHVRSTAVIDLAARIALESAGLRLPLAFIAAPDDQDLPPHAILIGASNPCATKLPRRPAPVESGGRIEVVDSFVVIQGANPEEEDAVLRYAATCLPGLREYGKGRASLTTIEDQVRRHTVSPTPQSVLVFDETLSFPWEVAEAREKIEALLAPRIANGSSVDLDLRVSEPVDVRHALEQELIAQLRAWGADMSRSHVRVLSAHKQGFSWISENVLQRLTRLKGATVVRVAYRALQVAPASVDSRRRWLEELYPIDEVLAKSLGIPLDSITFHELSPDAPHTYEVIAENAFGETILRASLETRSIERPLFDIFPDYAHATVATGGFRALVDGALAADERIATDYERFWDSYQSQTLPRIRDYILQLHRNPDPERAPHFAELRVDVELSEPDMDLGIDQERLSTLEALHEDLYFETLLFFDVLGTRTCGQPLRYPGRIIPTVTQASGQGGRARVRLSGYTTPMPARTFPDGDPRVTAVNVENGKGVVSVEVQVRETAFCWPLSGVEDHPLPHADAGVWTGVSWRKPISPAECERLIAGLARFPEVRPFHAGVSFLGQSVWAMDVVAPVVGKYVSQAKTALSKPCLFVTGRQHANEVSSTSHIMKLVELLATSPEHRALLQRVNFIIHPMANPDGAALVDELSAAMPGFMLHAGYLGALGVDMTEGQWTAAPRYPEARVRADLWRMWLPDIVLNPHGYPSHEWVQLFAGYTAWVRSRNVTARDWWIPRGWFVPRFDYIEDDQFPGHSMAALLLRDGISEAVNRTFGAFNERIYRRYAKYTGASLNLHDKVLVYMPPKGSAPDSLSQSFMTRHPHITFFEGLSEAPDEVAVGEWLQTLAAIGLEVTLVHARFLAGLPHEVERTCWEEDDRLYFSLRNPRRQMHHT